MTALSHSRRRVLGSSAVAIRDMNSTVGIATRISPEPDRSSDPRHRGSGVPAGRGWGESRVDPRGSRLFPNHRVEATPACRPVRGLAAGAAVPHSFRSGATNMSALSHTGGRVGGSSAVATGGMNSTVGIAAVASREPGRLSGGQRRGIGFPAGRSSGDSQAYRRCLSLFPNTRVEATAACRPVRGLASGVWAAA